ncbi:hypothetical protein L917_02613 [Phytophthora nicotianae]|uniref:Uncharacterized protein n=1 Tax=Phytophthora nicotianae TaxID=4792 RepID=W2P1S3_PHYNI|nr:hypothetical protein L917_02613 [Phytophthora nicotianae]ETM53869.1 hypothetical protein L914_02692 [Phytophthora nicotianae]
MGTIATANKDTRVKVSNVSLRPERQLRARLGASRGSCQWQWHWRTERTRSPLRITRRTWQCLCCR